MQRITATSSRARSYVSIALLALSLCRTAHGAGSFVPTGSMREYRYQHTATLLPNGRVLVTGGVTDVVTTITCADPNGEPFEIDSYASRTAELFDPATGVWTSAGAMHALRAFNTATL